MGAVSLPERSIPAPALVSAKARAALARPRVEGAAYPPLDDKAAWRSLLADRDAVAGAARTVQLAGMEADVEACCDLGPPVYVATPRAPHLVDQQRVVLEIHGGALAFGGGEGNVRNSAARRALMTGRKTYSVDYGLPPDRPYPAGLDDCVEVYKRLLGVHRAHDVIVLGTSAGGNLAAALTLRLRDAGEPLPAALALMTPELDLTESGDSFNTMLGLDPVLPARLMTLNLLYADGADLRDPYLSPLFGDVSGFPPTFLQTGTRDLFLSNTVVMHRKLRKAGVRAELHVWEAMPHASFDAPMFDDPAPEDDEVGDELRAFLASL